MSVDHFEVKWQAPEFEEYPKGISWYWLSIIVAIIFLTTAVWQKNFLFGFFIVVAEILILTWASRKPKMVSFILNERGLAIGDRLFYAYDELSSFSIKKESLDREWPAINLIFSKRLRPSTRIHLPKNQLDSIQKALELSVKRVEAEPSLLDTVQDILKF